MLSRSALRALATWLGLCLAAAGCGGQEEESGSPDSGMPQPDGSLPDDGTPAARIDFPPASSVIYGGRVTVRGTARDADGVNAVFVDGTVASLRSPLEDGSVPWEAEVSLPESDATLAVEVVDEMGHRVETDASVEVRRPVTPLNAPTAIALDAGNQRVLVLDDEHNALLAIDLATGSRTTLSSADIGTGPVPDCPTAMILDPADNRVLLTNLDQSSHEGDGDCEHETGEGVIAIDLDTGNRTMITGNEIGSGASFFGPQGLALDAERQRLLVVDTGFCEETCITRVVEVDLDTGERALLPLDGAVVPDLMQSVVLDTRDPDAPRALILDTGLGRLLSVALDSGAMTEISGFDTGSGPSLPGYGSEIALDAANDRVLVAARQALLAVDLDTGNRTLLSGVDAGEGMRLIDGRSLAFDAANGRALIMDGTRDALFAVDLDSGDRAVLSGDMAGAGPALVAPRGVALDPVAQRALVTDEEHGALFAIDLAMGQRSILSDGQHGGGPGLSQPVGVALDEARQQAVIADRSISGLYGVALDTGDRKVLSGPDRGDGTIANAPLSFALDTTRDRALILDTDRPPLFAADLSTGDRMVLADTGDSDDIRSYPMHVAVDTERDRALVLHDSGELSAFDLTRSVRTLLAGEELGEGILLDRAQALALDAERDRVLVVDDVHNGLFAIDLVTGDRSLVSNLTFGPPNIPAPAGLAVDPDRDVALVVDQDLDALIAIDLLTGERALLSR